MCPLFPAQRFLFSGDENEISAHTLLINIHVLPHPYAVVLLLINFRTAYMELLACDLARTLVYCQIHCFNNTLLYIIVFQEKMHPKTFWTSVVYIHFII